MIVMDLQSKEYTLAIISNVTPSRKLQISKILHEFCRVKGVKNVITKKIVTYF